MSAAIPELSKSSGEQLGGPIRLDKNENAYGPSPKAVEAVRAALDFTNRYSRDEYGQLAEKIANSHKIKPEQVTVGAGSREILRMALAAYLPSDRKFIVGVPTFDGMGEIARLSGATHIEQVPLTKRFGHDLEAMLAQADASAGVIYVCNPNNPTGTLTPREDLEVFVRKLPSRVKVVIDEAYHEYVGGTSDYASFIDRPIEDERVIVTRTFSKIYGLAGLRLGYSVSTPQCARTLSSNRLPCGVGATAARAAVAALDDADYIRLCAKRNADDRQEFYNQVNARMLRGIDSLTNFVMMKTGMPALHVAEHFRKNNVLLGPIVPEMDRYVRVSIGTPADMREFWRVWGLLPHGMSM